MSDSDCKTCTMCKQSLPLSAFNKNRSKRSGLADDCRECMKAYLKKYVSENLDAHKARGRATYLANPAKVAAQSAAWQKANPEKHKAARARFRDRHRESINARARISAAKHAEKNRATDHRWRQANPEKCNEYVRARQARKLRQMPAWADRSKILAVYAEARRLTRETGVKHHVDHVIPLKGTGVSGLHVEYNLAAIPAIVNQRKANKLMETARSI